MVPLYLLAANQFNRQFVTSKPTDYDNFTVTIPQLCYTFLSKGDSCTGRADLRLKHSVKLCRTVIGQRCV